MRYIKVFFLVIVFFLAMMFFVQNQTSFADQVTLTFDLFFMPVVNSIPIPLYALMLMCFTAGAVLVLFMLVWDRMSLSTRFMRTRHRANSLEKKLTKLEGELAGINEKNDAILEEVKSKHQTALEKLQAELDEKEKRLDEMMRS